MTARIDILLATCNSSGFLAQTIDSILQQDTADWLLLISDGGSTDDTGEMIEQYTQQHPEKIILLPSEKPLSARENFSGLLNASSSDYVMFCDHDDIWLPDKISKTRAAMKQAQQQYGPQTPLFVFTDKRVVDDKLAVISDSYLKYQKLNPLNTQLSRLLVQNVPSGCTMLMNRSLVDLCLPIPSEAVMHDHWVALVAAIFGKIIYLDEPTVLYRQHDRNYYGASNYGWSYFFRRYHEGIDAVRNRFYQNVAQAAALRVHFSGRLQLEVDELLKDFASLKECSWMKRRRILIKHRIFKTGFRRNLGMFLIV